MKLRASLLIYLLLSASILASAIFVYVHRVTFLYSAQMPSYFGGFLGSWLGFCSAMSAVAYAFNLQSKRDSQKETRDLKALAIALRAECKNAFAIVGSRLLSLELILQGKTEPLVDLNSNVLFGFRFPEGELIPRSAERIALLGGNLANELLNFRHMAIGANVSFVSALAPMPDGGKFLPLHGIREVEEWMRELVKTAITCRDMLTDYIGDGEKGLRNLEELRASLDQPPIIVVRTAIKER